MSEAVDVALEAVVAVVAHEVKERARGTALATTQATDKVAAIQEQVAVVVQALDSIGLAVERVNKTQTVVNGVLSEQTAVTQSTLT